MSTSVRNSLLDSKNWTITKIASELHHSGWHSNDVIALLIPLGEKEGIVEIEIRQKVLDIFEKLNHQSTSPNHTYIASGQVREITEVSPCRLEDFLKSGPDKIDWHVENLIPMSGVAILASPPGYGKSWLLHDLAISTATGKNWLGQFPTAKGPVLYIDEESSPILLRNRFKRLLKERGLSDTEIEICPLIGEGFKLTKDTHLHHIYQLIQEVKPRLLILDSFIRFHGSEENSATEMSRVSSIILNLARSTGCTIVIADHQRKFGTPGEGSGLKLRGSSEKVAFVDTLISMRKSKGRLVVEHSKSRYAEPIDPFCVSIIDTVKGVSVSYVGETKQIEKNSIIEEVSERILKKLNHADWVSRKELINCCKESGYSRNCVDDALKELTTKLIMRENRKPDQGQGGKQSYFRLIASEENNE